MSSLSVVIPTKDRVEVLAKTLDALEKQTSDEFDVVVVDNGSRPDALTQVRRRIETATTPIRLLESPSGGPAAARNAGVAASKAPAILLLGDDTRPAAPDLIEAHIALHEANPEESYGVLGQITWDPTIQVTPLMLWLENGGPQFAFSSLSPGPVDAAKFLYSSHVSLKRSMFDRVGGFDPRFPDAAIEDTEFGVRLAEAGIELDYHRELLVLHNHPTTLKQSLARQVRVGRSAALYNELRPDHPHPDIRRPRGAAWVIARITKPLVELAARIPLPLVARERVWLALHRERYAKGYRLGSPESP